MMNKLKKYRVLLVLSIIIIFITCTFAWYNYQTSKTSLVLSIGDITEAKVILTPYEINKTVTPINVYSSGIVSNVTAINNSSYTLNLNLYYEINSLPSELISNGLKYTITKSTSETGTYEEVLTGDFTSITDNKQVILDTTIESNTTTYYKLYLWLDSSLCNQTEISSMNIDLMLNGNLSQLTLTISDLVAKANPISITTYTDGDTHEMYTFSHDATEQTEALTDYRYIGKNPYNYITFNNETWRIIGVFDGMLKIIKNDTIGDYRWDYKKSDVGSSSANYGSNTWTDSQLMLALNGDLAVDDLLTNHPGYTNSSGLLADTSGNVFYQLGYIPYEIDAGETSYTTETSFSWSLNDTAKSQIVKTTYYLGGRNYGSTTYYGTAEDIYTWERGTDAPSGSLTSWSGYIALAYPSDYAFTFADGVDNTCYSEMYYCSNGTPSNSWMYKSTYWWLLSSFLGIPDSIGVYYVDTSGSIYSGLARIGYGTFPVVYLKSSTILIGTGTSSNPYVIISW